VKFLIDAQLPPSLAQSLKSAGHESIHVFDVKLISAPDTEIWSYALKTGAAILTKDQDFAALRHAATAGPVVIWLRMGNIANAVLAERLIASLPQIVSAVENGEPVIELR
jgi:predicted nuclease of predicted toxin-antitoxin system